MTTTGDQFLADLNTAVDEAVTSLKNDMALNADKCDGMFLLGAAQEMSKIVQTNPDEGVGLVYTLIGALHRVAELEHQLNESRGERQ